MPRLLLSRKLEMKGGERERREEPDVRSAEREDAEEEVVGYVDCSEEEDVEEEEKIRIRVPAR